MDQIDLSNFFQTKTQAVDFSNQLKLIAEKIYQTKFDLEKELTNQFGIKKRDAFLRLLRENKIDIKSATALKKFLTNLQENIAALPVISLTVAFEPKEKMLKSLSEWIVLHSNRQMLLDITVNQDLIAVAK